MRISSKLKAQIEAIVPRAKAEAWSVYLDHCLARITLDAYCQACWYDVLDVRRPALEQIRNLEHFETILRSLNKQEAHRLNQLSLRYRRRRLQVGEWAFIQVGTRRVRRAQRGLVVQRGLHTAVLEVAGSQETFSLRSLRTSYVPT